ncbi:MAG TPA: AmmeMemoRadiSam system protein B [Spirochaetia bacterium]|nr:AmmeMemoRadiSam system protein B [Spirochaetia bacterium]
MIENSGSAKLREAVVSGIFYPEDPDALRAAVEGELGKAAAGRGDAAAILSPHAAFEYAGAVAAAAWAAASRRVPSAVVLLAPYHRAEESAVWLPEAEVFQTPLGDVMVDRAYVEELESCGTLFRQNDIPHFEEHGIEVQLPFLQVLFPKASVVPVLLGKPSPSAVESLAKALSLVFSDSRESVLFVVSTNFAGHSSAEEASRRFERVLSYLASGDDESLYGEYKSETPDMCGVGCLASLMRSRLLGGRTWKLLERADSGSKRSTPAERIVYYAGGVWV